MINTGIVVSGGTLNAVNVAVGNGATVITSDDDEATVVVTGDTTPADDDQE